MKPGKIVEKFSTIGRDGKKLAVVFRFPKKGDAKKMLGFVNRARDSAKFLGLRRHETLKTEKTFLLYCLEEIRKGKGVFLIVEVGGKMIGSSGIFEAKWDSMKHVGGFGILFLEEFTGLGIGTRLAKRMLYLAKKETKFRMVNSGYFLKNKISGALHKKLGFKKYGELPGGAKLRGKGFDNLLLVYKKIRK